MNMVCNIMKMRHILRDSETWQSLSSGAICAVGRDGADNLDALCPSEVDNRAATYPVDRHSINEVSVSELLPCANISREEAQVIGCDSRESKPPDFGANFDELSHWRKCYRDLWKLKIAFEKKNNSRVGFQIPIYHPILWPQK